MDGQRELLELTIKKLQILNRFQLSKISTIINNLSESYIEISRNSEDVFGSEEFVENFGDILRIHHSLSLEPLSKDKFEYALEAAIFSVGGIAERAARGNPGFDLRINGEKLSLKTEASKSLKSNQVHISKFMELGKGEWDYNLLIEQFFSHLEKYERIFTLRCITKNNPFWHYELVELPKALLLETTGKEFRVVEQSKQNPKPMYCEVFDESGLLKFALYFDGGTERKLQVQKIDKTYCKLHASWKFHVISEALE